MVRARRYVVVACAASLASGCAHGGASARQARDRGNDPRTPLIAEAESHFAAGVAQSRQGHLNRARQEFDKALDVFLNAPGGAYAAPALAEAYRRTLEAIHLQEMEALAAGDGFTETLPEPASIDELGDLPVPTGFPSDDARRTAEEILRGSSSDLTIELNDAVLSCIELYQGSLREWFEAALGRGGRYLPRIREVFSSQGLPQDLAYVALVESAFKTGALSRARAKGMWQFIPDTGRRFGLDQDWWVDERSSPEKATQAAARYLKTLHGLFGDWNLALAAYNAGEGAILRAMDREGTSDFWELARTRYLARETKNYVPMIHAAIVVAKALDKYGFEVTPELLLTCDSVLVTGAVDLRLVAECGGFGLDQIQLLNPELRRLATPAGRTFPLKVPAGAGPAVRQCIDAIPPEKRVTFRTHVVARGETLFALSRRYGSRPQAIAEANGLGPGRPLARGAELIIPIDPRSSAAGLGGARAADSARDSISEPAPVRVSYRVKPGDTLARIASRFRTSISNLRSWNRLRDTRLAAGHTLTIYTHQPF